MNSKLILKLMSNEYKNNKRTIVPYLVAGSLTVMVFFILMSLAYCPYLYVNHKEAFEGAQILAILMEMAGQITGIFAK